MILVFCGVSISIPSSRYWKTQKSKNSSEIKFPCSLQGFKDFYFLDHSLELDNNSFTLIYDIYEGPKYYHRNVEWFGNDLVSDSTLTDAFDFESGDLFNLEKFNFQVVIVTDLSETT